MKVFIWNIHDFGCRGRQNQLKDFIRINKVDIIFLQETIRLDFSLVELDSLEVGDKFFGRGSLPMATLGVFWLVLGIVCLILAQPLKAPS
jgi:hypothetical protein